MSKTIPLIILFIMVSFGCAPTAVVTESCIGGDAICREYDPKTGELKRTYFGKERSAGYTVWTFLIYDGPLDDEGIPVRQATEGRQVINMSESFGFYQPGYNCGGWGCSFWP